MSYISDGHTPVVIKRPQHCKPASPLLSKKDETSIEQVHQWTARMTEGQREVGATVDLVT